MLPLKPTGFSHHELSTFYEAYMTARRNAKQWGIVTDDEVGFQNEYDDFREKIKGSGLYTFLAEKDFTPTEFEAPTGDNDITRYERSVIGLCRKWFRAKFPGEIVPPAGKAVLKLDGKFGKAGGPKGPPPKAPASPIPWHMRMLRTRIHSHVGSRAARALIASRARLLP